MSPLSGDGGTQALQVLAHVRQDDTPEHDVRRPWAPAEHEDGARPVLVSHPSDHALKTVPTLFNLFRRGLLGHGGMLVCVDRVDRMGRLPREIERFFPGERACNEAGLSSKTQPDVVGDDHRRPALGRALAATLLLVEAAGRGESVAYKDTQIPECGTALLAHGVFATSRPAKNERIHSMSRLARLRTPRSCMR